MNLEEISAYYFQSVHRFFLLSFYTLDVALQQFLKSKRYHIGVLSKAIKNKIINYFYSIYNYFKGECKITDINGSV